MSNLSNSVLFRSIDYSKPNASAEKNLVIDFLNQELQQSVDFSIEQEYPSLFQPLPGGKSFFFIHQNQIIAHVGCLVRQFQGPSWEVRIGLIGSVATHKDYRNQGLATQLLTEAVKFLKEQQCVLSVLWSDQPDFYNSLGFFRCGLEKDFRFSVRSVGTSQRSSRLAHSPQDMEAVWKLYSQKQFKVTRSLEEMKALLSIPQVKLYVTEDAGQVNSYLAINKGKDFTHYIHEWAGEIEWVKTNIISCQTGPFKSHNLTLISPFDTEDTGFQSISEKQWLGSLGLVKLLDRKAFSRVFETHTRSFSHSPVAPLSESISDEEFLIQVLGKDGWSSSVRLPLFLWGFDSI